MILVMAAVASPNRAAAHCGEHGDSCGPSEWHEVSGGGCESAADPFDYGTWWQPYRVQATWCDRPVLCVAATCSVDAPCAGVGRTCVNGTCSCPRGTLAECASCGGACEYDAEVPFPLDARCWPWGIEMDVPCAGPLGGGTWRNHGAYVSALAHLLAAAAGDGLISESQHDALMEAGAESSCGRT
jgi:hypothetical protein